MVVVIRSAGSVLQDVLQVVRRWVWWWNVIDGEWAQRWALWRLWLAEIGRQLFLSAFLNGRHYSLLWFSGVLSHNYSQLVCVHECVHHHYDPSEAGGFPLKIFSQAHRCSDTLTHWRMDGCAYLLTSVVKLSLCLNHSQIIPRCEETHTNEKSSRGFCFNEKATALPHLRL